jgi:hypothetical protein
MLPTPARLAILFTSIRAEIIDNRISVRGRLQNRFQNRCPVYLYVVLGTHVLYRESPLRHDAVLE